MPEDKDLLKIKSFEQPLINFLLEKKEYINKIDAGAKRVRSLQIRTEGEGSEASIIVSIGIFEAEFNILTGLKIQGSCFGLERPIRDWLMRENIRTELLKLTEVKRVSVSKLRAAKNRKLQRIKQEYTNNILNAIDSLNYEKAERLIDEAIWKYQSADLYYYKSFVFISQNDCNKSIEALNQCIELDKNYVDAYFYLAASYDNLGDNADASINYQNFLNMAAGSETNRAESIAYSKMRILQLKQQQADKTEK